MYEKGSNNNLTQKRLKNNLFIFIYFWFFDSLLKKQSVVLALNCLQPFVFKAYRGFGGIFVLLCLKCTLLPWCYCTLFQAEAYFYACFWMMLSMYALMSSMTSSCGTLGLSSPMDA